MRNTNAKSKSLLLAAMVVGLVTMSSLSAGAKSWKDETVLISPQGDQTFVRPLEGDETLFKNSDPQLAVEWALASARTAVLLAGKYVVSDSIDIPRDDVTLIIDQGAEISLNPQTEHKTDIGFRPAGSWHMVPLIYNHGHEYRWHQLMPRASYDNVKDIDAMAAAVGKIKNVATRPMPGNPTSNAKDSQLTFDCGGETATLDTRRIPCLPPHQNSPTNSGEEALNKCKSIAVILAAYFFFHADFIS